MVHDSGKLIETPLARGTQNHAADLLYLYPVLVDRLPKKMSFCLGDPRLVHVGI